MASTEVNERQRLTQAWRTAPSTAPFYIVKNVGLKRCRNTIHLPALMQDSSKYTQFPSTGHVQKDGSKGCLRGAATPSEAGRGTIMRPCINTGQSEIQGVRVGEQRVEVGGLPGQKNKDNLWYPEYSKSSRTLMWPASNSPRNILERAANSPLALSATS